MAANRTAAATKRRYRTNKSRKGTTVMVSWTTWQAAFDFAVAEAKRHGEPRTISDLHTGEVVKVDHRGRVLDGRAVFVSDAGRPHTRRVRGWHRIDQLRLNRSQVAVPGTVVRVAGRRGRFVFESLVRNPDTGRMWVDVRKIEKWVDRDGSFVETVAGFHSVPLEAVRTAPGHGAVRRERA